MDTAEPSLCTKYGLRQPQQPLYVIPSEVKEVLSDEPGYDLAEKLLISGLPDETSNGVGKLAREIAEKTAEHYLGLYQQRMNNLNGERNDPLEMRKVEMLKVFADLYISRARELGAENTELRNNSTWLEIEYGSFQQSKNFWTA